MVAGRMAVTRGLLWCLVHEWRSGLLVMLNPCDLGIKKSEFDLRDYSRDFASPFTSARRRTKMATVSAPLTVGRA